MYDFFCSRTGRKFFLSFAVFVTLALSIKSCDHLSMNIGVVYPRWDKVDICAIREKLGQI